MQCQGKAQAKHGRRVLAGPFVAWVETTLTPAVLSRGVVGSFLVRAPAATSGSEPSANFPQTFGRYTLLGRIGSGGMADALLAMLDGPMGFRKPMVIKRMHASLGSDSHFVKMFLDEARLAARLNHPHVVATSEVGECDGHYFIAMEYLEGLSLDRVARRYIQQFGGLPLGFLLRVLCDCLAGLHYAHELRDYDGAPLNVVHRDVTPSNLFITVGGVAKVLDFGIAKAATQDEATRTGMLKGKLAYMAPEQFMAEPIDRRADLWSMGVVIWEMVTGRRLFKGPNDAQTYKNIVGADVPPLSVWRVDAPRSLDAIIARALARDRTARYPTAEAMRVDLEAVLRDELGATTHGDVAVAMREHFGDTLEENRRTIREFLQTRERVAHETKKEEAGQVGAKTHVDVSAFVPQLAQEPDDDAFAPRAAPMPKRPVTLAAPVVRVSSPPVRPAPVSPAPVPPVPPVPSVPLGKLPPPGDENGVETVVDLRLPRAYVDTARAVVRGSPPVMASNVFSPEALPAPGTALPAFGEPLPQHASTQHPPRQGLLVTMVGWLTLLGIVGALGFVGWSQRDFIARGVRELVQNTPPDPLRVGTFQLRLVSDPPGARVFEGSTDLGPTPLELPVLRGAVADAPRRFEFRLPGYATATAAQGTTREPRVELRVRLVPLPPRR